MQERVQPAGRPDGDPGHAVQKVSVGLHHPAAVCAPPALLSDQTRAARTRHQDR